MKKKGKIKVLSISYKVVATVFFLLLLLSYASVLVDPAVLPIAGFFGLYFIPVLIINILLLIISLLRWSSAAWISLAAILPSLFFAGAFLRLEKDSGNVAEPQDCLKILTYNVGGFRSGSGSPSQNLESIAAFIESEKPQIVSLQEFRTADPASIPACFPGYPYSEKHFYRLRNGEYVGNLTLSSLPMVSGGHIDFKKSTNMVVYTDIRYGNGTFRLYNVHLESNNISLPSVVRKIRDGYDEFSQELAEAHEKVKKSSTRRGSQVRALLDNISESGLPAVICGDVNDTPMSYCFHSLSHGRKDTFQEAGNGFGATYRILWPLLRIDYVFVPEDTQVIGHRTPRVGYSDHYPVIAAIDMTH